MKTLRCRNCSIPSHKNIFFFLAEISSNQDSTWWGEKSFMTEFFFHHKPYLAWHSMFRAYYHKNCGYYKKKFMPQVIKIHHQLNPPDRQILLFSTFRAIGSKCVPCKASFLKWKTVFENYIKPVYLDKVWFWAIRGQTFMRTIS